jgi:hypothetical protein
MGGSQGHTTVPHFTWQGAGPFPFRLESPHTFHTGIEGFAARAGAVEIKADGTLLIGAGFRWDGASGPACDNPAMLVASLAHDATCILHNTSGLPFGFRRMGDVFFRTLLMANGSHWLRAWYTYLAVSLFSYKVGVTRWLQRGNY